MSITEAALEYAATLSTIHAQLDAIETRIRALQNEVTK